ncbi:MAG: hypothetical protein RBR73_03570, partial [Halothiobacillaceae bacterium]|nr:hypothetical protein [Halothiobacillaceae bacterium]
GWTGYGYIIVDPETGAGAYLIEGKGNGMFLAALDAAEQAVIALIHTLQNSDPVTVGFAILVLSYIGKIGAVVALGLSALSLIADMMTLMENASSPCEIALSGLIGSMAVGLLMLGVGIGKSTQGAAIGMAIGAIVVSWVANERWVQSVCGVVK